MSRSEVWPDEFAASAPIARRMAAINSASADVYPISLLPTQRHTSGPHITASKPAKTGTRGTLYGSYANGIKLGRSHDGHRSI
jgi:hypothetical protein